MPAHARLVVVASAGAVPARAVPAVPVRGASRAAPQPRRCLRPTRARHMPKRTCQLPTTASAVLQCLQSTRAQRHHASHQRCSPESAALQQAGHNTRRCPTRPPDAAVRGTPTPRRCSVCRQPGHRRPAARSHVVWMVRVNQSPRARASASLGPSVRAQAPTALTGWSTVQSGSALRRSASRPACP